MRANTLPAIGSRVVPENPCYRCGGSANPWHSVPVNLIRGVPNRFSETFWCRDCEVGFTRPLPSREGAAAFYDLDTYYTHGGNHLQNEENATFLDRLRFHLAWRLDHGVPLDAARIHAILGGKASTICDIGCGSGSLAAALAGLGHSVTGVEFDTATAANNCRGAISLHYGSAEELPKMLAKSKFDCVVMTHVLEHCVDPMRALENVGALLAPRGVFLCEVPNNDAIGIRMAGPASIMFDAPRHLHFFTAKSLEGACRDSGLAVVETHFEQYCRQFAIDWIKTERAFWQTLHGESRPALTKIDYWKLLTRTAFARDEQKYDSVWVRAILA